MSWITVVGINRVDAVERYVDAELVVWIPNPRSTRRDSSEYMSVSLYPLLILR